MPCTKCGKRSLVTIGTNDGEHDTRYEKRNTEADEAGTKQRLASVVLYNIQLQAPLITDTLNLTHY